MFWHRVECRDVCCQVSAHVGSSEMPGGRIDYSGAYTDFVLMHSTSRSRLYRAVRGGKYFMLKTAATADGMQEASLRREYELSLGMQHQHVATVLTYEPSLPVGPAIVME